MAAPGKGPSELPEGHSMRRPLIALAITKRWISEVPSKIV
jgi:hypothetical protein